MPDRLPCPGSPVRRLAARRVIVMIAIFLAAAPAWVMVASGGSPARAAMADRSARTALRTAAASTRAAAIRDVLVTASARLRKAPAKGRQVAVLARLTRGQSYRLLARVTSRHRVAVAIARGPRSGARAALLTRYRPISGTLKRHKLAFRLRVTGTSPVRLAGTVTLGRRHVSLAAVDRSRGRLTRAGAIGVWPRSRAVRWSKPRASTVRAPAPAKPAAITGRPYLDRYSQAWKAYAAETNRSIKRQYYNIAATSSGTWVVGGSQDISNVKSIMAAAARAGTVPQLVLYALPGRDCGGYSSGGLSSAAAYRAWVSSIASAIGTRRAIVILEPDAISFCNNNGSVRAEWTSLLTYAAKTLHDRAPHAVAYLHAGSAQLSYSYVVSALRASGIRYLRGFAMNVSSIGSTAKEVAYGNALVSRLAAAGVPGRHYVVDTSRNGAGSQPNPGARYSSCNNPNAALGTRPTTRTASSRADAYLWIKPPGSSDGTCHSGDPSAGKWFPSSARALVDHGVSRHTISYWALP